MSMDRSAVQTIVEGAIGPMQRLLGIAQWRVKVEYGPIDDRRNPDAMCTRQTDYGQALIEIDPERFDTEQAVLRALRHEMLHIVLAPFDLHGEMALNLAPDEHEATLRRIWALGTEQTVLGLERMLDAWGAHPEAMAGEWVGNPLGGAP